MLALCRKQPLTALPISCRSHRQGSRLTGNAGKVRFHESMLNTPHPLTTGRTQCLAAGNPGPKLPDVWATSQIVPSPRRGARQIIPSPRWGKVRMGSSGKRRYETSRTPNVRPINQTNPSPFPRPNSPRRDRVPRNKQKILCARLCPLRQKLLTLPPSQTR